MGVRRIREFNIALLGKWCWRLLEDNVSMWFRVLAARYGLEGGRLLGGGREASMWWCDIYAICREEWFTNHVSRSIGNGENTLFWYDVWCGGEEFRVRFNRLYDLSSFKGSLVSDMCYLGWMVDGEAWQWRRRLFVWEEGMLGGSNITASECEFTGS